MYLKLFCSRNLKYIGVENVPASCVMHEGIQLTFRVDNDNLDLGWATNGNCILRSLILDERESGDTGIGDVWQLNFKPIGLIVSPPDINIYGYGPICEGIPNNCYFVTSMYETGILDLHVYLKLPSNIPKILDIRRHGFWVMPSKCATSHFHQGSTISYPNHVVIDLRIPCKGNIEGASGYVSISREQSWHQIYLLHELWPENDAAAKMRYIQKPTKSFAYDEDTKVCKNGLE